MKSKAALIFILTACLLLPVAGFAQQMFFEGEGYITPTPKSQEEIRTKALTRQATPDPVDVIVDASQFPDIVLYVTVLGASGEPVTGLTQSDFALMEQSELENLPEAEALTCFEEIQAGPGVSFSFVFDISQSMAERNKIDDSKAAAADFLNNVIPDDRASLVSFSGCNETDVVLPVDSVQRDSDGDGVSNMAEGVDDISTTDGQTALFDGIGAAINSLDQEPSPRGVIVFTDGNSNADCVYSANDVIQEANLRGMPVYIIGIGVTEGSDTETTLHEIADQTGGLYRSDPTLQDMTEVYEDLSERIANQYILCYTSHNPDYDGTTRNVFVTADGADGTGSYTVGLNNPPVIVHTPVETAVGNQAVTISADISDPDAGDGISQAVLYYRVVQSPEAPFMQIPMTIDAGSTYSAVIPANQVTAAGVEYYISAADMNQASAYHGTEDDPHLIQVSGGNVAPVANAGPDQSVTEGDAVTLDGSASSDPGDVITYNWRQTSGPTVTLTDPTSATPEFVAPPVGTSGARLVFELMVTDASGASDTDAVVVNVNDFSGPTAAFTWSPASPTTDDDVVFTDQSVPNADNIVSWLWDFGALGAGAEQNPEFNFPEAGAYSVTLTVTDAAGLSNSATNIITVTSAPSSRCEGGDCGGGSGGCFIRAAADRSGLAGFFKNLLK